MVTGMCMPQAVMAAKQVSEDAEGALARGLRERDPKALAAVYDRYGRMVFGLILRAVRDRALAEDLVQETFLRVWSRAGSFDDQRGDLGNWILAVARNRTIDYQRSVSGRMAAGAVSLQGVEGCGPLVSGDDGTVAIDRRRRLENALRKLTPKQQELIRLAYYDGLSHSELARRLQQPLGTVKTWVGAALRLLRTEMGGMSFLY